MATAAPLPPPLPVLADSLPPAPAAPTIQLGKFFYVRFAHRSHGKQVIRKHLKSKKHNFGKCDTFQLPQPGVLFYWVQREWMLADHLIKNYDTQPCLAHIPLQRLLCNKVEGAETMREYYGEAAWTFVPESYTIRCRNIETRGYDYSEVEDVIRRQDGEQWILKSNLGFFGTEVHVFSGNSVEELDVFIRERFETNNFNEHFVDKMHPENGRGLIVSARGNDIVMQTYIANPLLCDGRKFDLRCYCLIASIDPCVAFFHKGKMRLSGVDYTEETKENEEWRQKTNCHIQRLHEDYNHDENAIDGKEMLRSWEEFIEWMYSVRGQFDASWFVGEGGTVVSSDSISLEDFGNLVDWKIRVLLGKTVDACGDYFDATNMLPNRRCSFAFHGADVMIDEKGNFWWLETNRVPALNMAGPQEISLMTETMLQELVDIELEVRRRKLRDEELVDDEGNLVVQLESLNAWKAVPLSYRKKTRELNQEILATLDEPPPRKIEVEEAQV